MANTKRRRKPPRRNRNSHDLVTACRLAVAPTEGQIAEAMKLAHDHLVTELGTARQTEVGWRDWPTAQARDVFANLGLEPDEETFGLCDLYPEGRLVGAFADAFRSRLP